WKALQILPRVKAVVLLDDRLVLQAQITRQNFFAQIGIVLNFSHARGQRPDEPYDHCSALFQQPRRVASALPRTGKFSESMSRMVLKPQVSSTSALAGFTMVAATRPFLSARTRSFCPPTAAICTSRSLMPKRLSAKRR